MKIVNNSVEYIAQNHNTEAHIEYCARVCYASLNNKKIILKLVINFVKVYLDMDIKVCFVMQVYIL